MYRDREWALDWVGGLHEAGCGAAVFLKTSTSNNWFCVGGIIKSEDERADGHIRKFKRFFLTTVFDEQGVDHAKYDHKVSLDYNLFKGYGGPSQPSTRQDEGTPIITYKKKGLTTGPSAARQKDYDGASGRAALRKVSEGSDEETEDDPRICVDRHPQGNHAVDDEEFGVEKDDVEEEKREREREGEDREESMQDCEDGESRQYDEGDYGGDGENDDAYPGDDEDGGQEGSTDVEVDEGTEDRSGGSVHKRNRRSSISPTATTDKRAAKRLTVAASRDALRASQEAVAENVKNRKGKASTRTTKAEKRPLKRKHMIDEGDSGEDAEGVAPRAPSEQRQPSADTRYDAIDTTRCFFVEFDEDGFAN
ncbi:hypothetical protein CBR_g23648 [Chara braunii]|uniref:Uncharacterized protein n=1 Tax=Chara braunii TaxID=69332 RepID=A0A388L4S1_CHABU|nr:hypothetical protein CBR_g23648 [Chara braunii]|eukprot:GBG77319.1 hypothetical protein CBR_g23648 [Chara braunii]